jgi:hypothetical protein
VKATVTTMPEGALVGVREPAAKEHLAEPATRVTLAHETPSGEDEKVTVPAGVPVPGPMAWTVAVNVRA